MKAWLSAALALVVATGTPRLGLAAQPPSDSPQQLYEDGRKAYRLSRYQEAVEKWERAYDLSANALLLYNIGLAYKDWYGTTQDIAHLRKAKAVFQNYIRETLRTTEGADVSEAEAQVVEVDALLHKAEEAERAKAAAEADKNRPRPDPGDTVTKPFTPTGSDPGKKLRLAGIGTMAGGGALVVAGGALGGFFAAKGVEFRNQIQDLRERQGDTDCDAMPNTTICQDIETTKRNGTKANLLVAISFGVLGGLGVAALVTGAVLFVSGNKRTKAWQSGQTAGVRVMPTFGGLVLHGRF